MAVNIKIKDLKKVIIEDTRKIEKKYKNAVKLAAKDTMDDIFNAAIVNILLKLQSKEHPHTNEILNAMYFKLVRETKNSIIYEIGNTFKWAKAIEYGTRAHSIDSAPDSYLVFEVPVIKDPRRRTYAKHGDNGGMLVFAKHVDHPGAKPSYFLQEAILDYAPRFEKYLDKYLYKAQNP